MLLKGMLVKIYDGDLVGWTFGILAEQYLSLGKLQKWRIETKDGSSLVRFVKEKYEYFLKDGCGYILKEGHSEKAKINFNSWDIDEYAESLDDPEYFRNIFLDNIDEIYKFIYTGEFWELQDNKDNDRQGTLFETKDLIFK